MSPSPSPRTQRRRREEEDKLVHPCVQHKIKGEKRLFLSVIFWVLPPGERTGKPSVPTTMRSC